MVAMDDTVLVRKDLRDGSWSLLVFCELLFRLVDIDGVFRRVKAFADRRRLDATRNGMRLSFIMTWTVVL